VSDESIKPERRLIKVVVADDDAFTLSLVADGLRALGFEVKTTGTVAGAWDLVNSYDPNALVSDLNFGQGASGATLLNQTAREFPWIGLVVLTSHASPELAVNDGSELPEGAVYLVKSQLTHAGELGEAVTKAIAGEGGSQLPNEETMKLIFLTSGQAEVLRMLAAGASTKALAEHRGTTVRAAETMLARLYRTMKISTDEESNPRVAAVNMWHEGRVAVRPS
jgi:DNA-binding NarL/FixJ family response regulator